MSNWLSQDIAVGDTVYRGARNGNSSEFKIGVVLKVTGDKIKVAWKYTESSSWIEDGSGPGMRVLVTFPWQINTTGTSSANTMVRVDPDLLHRAFDGYNLYQLTRAGDKAALAELIRKYQVV